jgi:hypothetical protein
MLGTPKSPTSRVRTGKRLKARMRRWHDPRPKPRRRTDLKGFNYTWWIAVVSVIVVALIVFPFPWW